MFYLKTIPYNYYQSTLWHSCSLNYITIEPIAKKDFGKPSWLPSQTQPWIQIALERARSVGLVKIVNQELTHCSSFWLYIGSYCRFTGHGGPLDTFEGAGNYSGFIVRVSNEPCEGNTCSGHICSTNASLFLLRNDIHNTASYIYCHEAVGKYVSVQLAGEDRVLSLKDLEVHVTDPVTVDEEGYVCYAVTADLPDTIHGEYVTSQDPEDPIFYSVSPAFKPNEKPNNPKLYVICIYIYT